MRLSIIVTIYNAEAFIEECIRSFYHQDLPIEEYEVIIVDNATPDGSMDIVYPLSREYSNLRLIKLEENRCAGGGRNAGLQAATGDYVMFVDADDYLYPNVIGTLLNVAENSDLDFLHFDYDVLTKGRVEVCPDTDRTTILSGSDLMFNCGFPWQEHIVVWRKMFKRSFLINNHLYFIEDIIFDDDVYVFQTYATAKRTQHIDYKAYVYRVYDNSTCHRKESISLVKCLMVQSTHLIKLLKQTASMSLNSGFMPAIKQLLRYNLSESLRCYLSFSGDDKREAYHIIKDSLNREMIPYVSKKKYILLKFGLL